MVPYTHTHTHKYTYMFKKWNKQKSTVKILYYNKRQIKKKKSWSKPHEGQGKTEQLGVPVSWEL